MNQMLPSEIIGHIFEYLPWTYFSSLFKEDPCLIATCCGHQTIQQKLMFNYIASLQIDDNNQSRYFNTKRSNIASHRRKYFNRGKEFVDPITKVVHTPNQTLMIFYPRKSLVVLFEIIGPYLKRRIYDISSGGDNYAIMEHDAKIRKRFLSHFGKIVQSLKLYQCRSGAVVRR